ncbi:MAG: prepilin-type N-terminal cleavage/methylation domain-containing protein [candidate division Zixibacteria bacterium]|nr:prepilin-type N-terminal cleavage/methylation domain-containing protein [candidate division Zixibacteria bacterium]
MTSAPRQKGFSLIELLIMVVVLGIMAAIALQSMSSAVEDSRRIQTERKMESLSRAIVGNPGIMQDGIRSDFGYVGDVGTFPPNLGALYTNPGIPTWHGPYAHLDHTEDTISFRNDAWGHPFTLSGVTLTATGHGTTMTKKMADAAGDYLFNLVPGSIRDRNDSTPGTLWMDSVRILVDIPSGASGLVTRSYKPSSSGAFALDSVPAGKRFFRFIYLPASDTIRRYYTVLPRHKGDPPLAVKFASAYFSGGGGAGGCSGNDSVVLRPNGAGSISAISGRTGCAANWQCVSEITADNAVSQVYENNNGWVLDQYALTDPPASTCAIVSVTVHCRAMRDQTQGDIRPAVHTLGFDYYGTSTPLTTSWANYSYTWTTNPNTGGAWTWGEITALQAGAQIRGQATPFAARLTQVYVVVKF